MTICKRLKPLLAALCIAAATPGTAQELPPAPPVEAVAGEKVTIPFAPPLGTPITYAVRFERKRPDGDSVTDFSQQLVFDKIDGGYVLRLEMLTLIAGGQRIDLTDPRVLDEVPLGLRPYLMSMTVELDDSGAMVRMRDWDATRKALRKLPEAAAAMSDRPLDDVQLRVIRAILAPIMNASAKEAPGIMIKGWPDVLGYGGAAFVPGETVETDTQVNGGMLPEPIPAVVQGSLTRTPAGELRLLQSTLADPEAMRAATAKLAERLRAQYRRKDEADPQDANASISITDDLDIAFDPVTGLPVTARLARITNVMTDTESQLRGEITTIRRLGP